MLCSLAGCRKDGLPQPKFPLEEDEINSALEQTGLPGVISESETASYTEGHILYVLRDPTSFYEGSENPVMTTGISSAITKGERFLGMDFFRSSPDEPATLPFVWEDWKQQIVFTTLLYGGFTDEEEVYLAFFDKVPPEDEETFEWDAQLPGGYCRVSYRLYPSKVIHTFPEPIVERYSYRVNATIYESKSLYQKLQQDMMEAKKALERSPAETPN